MRRFSRFALATFLTCAMGAAACAGGGGGGGGKKSTRARWVDKPQQGSTKGKITKIPGLGLTFEQPEVLYVYKECGEAAHSPESSDNDWVPVIRCNSVFGESGEEEDSWDSEDDGLGEEESVALTIYVAHKDAIINERAVETFRAKFQNAGFKVDEITYHEEYMAKPKRRGIEAKIQIIDTSSGYPSREILRFMFPREDVIFIAQIDYPFGDDRSGMMSDWQRILWNFQFDEDGKLYAEQGTGEEDAEE